MLAAIAGVPVATIAGAMTARLIDRNVRRVAVVTPYSDAVNAQLTAFLRHSGIEVVALDSFRARTVEELADISADAVARMAHATMTGNADGMFIACAQLPTLAILDRLEASFGRPVLSSLQSLAAQIVAMSGRTTAAAERR